MNTKEICPHHTVEQLQQISQVCPACCYEAYLNRCIGEQALAKENASMLDTIRNLESENGKLHTRVKELMDSLMLG